MRYLIVYAHPNPASFNHAVLEEISDELVRNGKDVHIRDLYALGFNPVMSANDLAGIREGTVAADVRAEQEQIAVADVVVMIYPLWWSAMPAMLKGYIDRVFSDGFAYRITDDGIEGLMKGKKAFLVTTTGASKDDYETSGFFKSMGQVTDMGILGSCGFEVLEHRYLSSVPYITDGERKQMLRDLRVAVRERLL
jgi:NAD(P)H dehydrogenase (quinone)